MKVKLLSLILLFCRNVFAAQSGVPAGAMGGGASGTTTTVAAGQGGNLPGGAPMVTQNGQVVPQGTQNGVPNGASCDLVPPDDFKSLMTELMAQLSSNNGCLQNSKSSNIVNDYVTNYLNVATPDGAYCYNYQTVVNQQSTYANTFTGTLSSAPTGPFSVCFNETFVLDSTGNQTVSYSAIPGCLESTKNSLLQNDATYCSKVRKTNYENHVVTDAAQSMTDAITNEKPGCRNLVAPMLDLAGAFVGMSPAGLTGAAMMQMLSGPLQKLLLHKDQLKGLLEAQAKKMGKGLRACQYFTLIQGILECKASDAKPGAQPCAAVQESVVTIRTLKRLQAQFEEVKAKFDLDSSVKDSNIDGARPVLNDKWMKEVNAILTKQVYDPEQPKTTVSTYDYLTRLSDRIPNDFAGAPLKKQMKTLLEALDPSKMEAKLYAENADADHYRSDVIKAILGITPKSSVPNPLDVSALIKSDSALTMVMNYEQSRGTANQLTNSLTGVTNSTEESANTNLSFFSKVPSALDDVKGFVKMQVERYKAIKDKGPESGLNPQMIFNVKREATQACTALASVYYYKGDQYNYELGQNSGFPQDYKNACGDLIDQNDVLKNIAGSKNPAEFKANVCKGM